MRDWSNTILVQIYRQVTWCELTSDYDVSGICKPLRSTRYSLRFFSPQCSSFASRQNWPKFIRIKLGSMWCFQRVKEMYSKSACMVWNGHASQGQAAIGEFIDGLPTSTHYIRSLDAQSVCCDLSRVLIVFRFPELLGWLKIKILVLGLLILLWTGLGGGEPRSRGKRTLVDSLSLNF